MEDTGDVTRPPSSERPGAELVTWLAALRALSADAISDADLQDVLCRAAETARSLFGFDFCGVLLPEPTGERLAIRGWSGLSDDYVGRVNSDRQIRLDSGSPSSRAFQTGEPVAIRDVADEPGFALWVGVARDQGYRAIIAVPMIAGTEVLGTLNGYYASVHTFTRYEAERLMLLANHAAIAVTSTRRLDELRRLNESLREQRDALTRSEQIHERLLAVTLRTGGLSGIAAVLRELLGQPVLIEDSRHVELAHAGDIAAFPDADRRADLVRDESVEGTAGFATDVRLGADVAARIWLPEDGGPLDPIGVRAVEHASIVVALELLRERTAAEVEHRLRGELLTDLLSTSGPIPAQLVKRAGRLGHDLTVVHRAIVSAVSGGPGAADRRPYERALTAVADLTASLDPRPLSAIHGGHLVTLWPTTGEFADAPGELVRRAIARAHPSSQVTVAVSPAGSATYQESYRTARRALEVALNAGRTNVVLELADLGIVGLLLQVDDADKLSDFAARTLGPILDYDRQHRTELLDTLAAYFTARQDRNTTAQTLLIHPNTVTQRLRRIERLCAVELGDPAATLELAAALTVHRVAALD